MVEAVFGRQAIGTLAACLLLVGGTSSAAKRPVTSSDALQWNLGAADFQYTPDRKLFAVEWNSHISVWSRQTRAPVKHLGEGLMPRWSPKGERLAFYSSRGGTLQLWCWQRLTGETIPLTAIHGGIDNDPSLRFGGWVQSALSYSWAPDGTRIVFPLRLSSIAVDADVAAPRVFHGEGNISPLAGVFAHADLASGVVGLGDGRTFSTRPRRPGETLSYQLALLDTRTRDITFIRADEYVLYNPVWSRDGRHIIAGRIQTGRDQDSFTQRYVSDAVRSSEIASFEPASGTWKTLVAGEGVRSNLKLSPDGKWLAFFVGDIRRVVDVRVQLLSMSDASQVTVTPLIGQSLWDCNWSPYGALLIQTFADIFRYLPESGIVKKAASGVESFAPAVDVGGRLQWVENNLLLEAQERSSIRKTLVDFDPGRAEFQFGSVRELHWSDMFGKPHHGWVLLPHGFDPATRYPVVVDAYPGLSGDGDWMDPLSGNQALAAQGYIIFRPSPRAPHTWTAVPPHETATREKVKGPDGWKVTEDDIERGLDALESAFPVQSSKVCLFGHSNGGGVVAHMLSVTDRFACAVIVAPALADWVRPALLAPDGRETMRRFADGPDFVTDPGYYLRLSSVFAMGNAKTPTLVAAGDQDGDFLLDAIEVFNALKSAGTPVTLVRYPDQGHLLAGPALADFVTRQDAFLDQYLSKP